MFNPFFEGQFIDLLDVSIHPLRAIYITSSSFSRVGNQQAECEKQDAFRFSFSFDISPPDWGLDAFRFFFQHEDLTEGCSECSDFSFQQQLNCCTSLQH